ncbi:MAG: prolipoprotein diacylglyceryl transferase family protein [Chitinophagaceae bacterium]
MINKIIGFWTKSPVMVRRDNFLFVWFGVIVGTVIFLAVLTILSFSFRIGEPRYIDYFHYYFLWWPLAAIGGAIFLFQGFWLQLRDAIGRVFSGKPGSWHRPGAVFYGGFIGSAILAIGLAAYFKISFLYAADFIFIIIPFFHGLARLGCLNFGCCYGKKCSPHLPLKVAYTHPLSEPVRQGFPAGESRHATQLYEMFLCMGLGIFLLYLAGRVPEGRIFATYLIGYGLIRFVLEFVRDNTFETTYKGISVWQLLSLGFVIAGILLWWLLPEKQGLQLSDHYQATDAFKIFLIALWNGAFIGITLGLHFRKRHELL